MENPDDQTPVDNSINDDIQSLRAVLSSTASIYQEDFGSLSSSVFPAELGQSAAIDTLQMDATNSSQLQVSSDPRGCLALNRRLQNSLKEQLKKCEAAQHENQELQEHVKSTLTQKPKQRKTKSSFEGGKRVIGTPYFIDLKTNQIPPDNPDALQKKKLQQNVPIAFKYKKWTRKEILNLAKGIRQQNQQLLLDKLMDEYANNGKTLDEFNREMEQIKTIPETELQENTVGINWDTLAKTHAPGRIGNDCKIYWLNNQTAADTRVTFTKEEDKKLLELAKKHKEHNWEAVATELGNDRKAYQCFTRYQRSLNINMMKGRWTPDEDRLLIKAVEKYGDKNWQQIAHVLEGRTGQQCLHRWQKTLNPNIRRGRWTKKEDEALRIAVEELGQGNWVKVQNHVPGRTDVQCRERWVNVLNPDLNNGAWTAEEDETLKEATARIGLGKWSTVAQSLYPRTDNQCWRRWKSLNSDQVEGYQQKVYKKKRGLVSNFVGRERERSGLTPDDFEFIEPINNQGGPPEVSVSSVTSNPSPLPLVFPSPVTFNALFRLTQLVSNQSETPKTNCYNFGNNSDFQVLTSWFNSLFLYPMLVTSNGVNNNNLTENQAENQVENQAIIPMEE